jgi:hypothetical protein
MGLHVAAGDKSTQTRHPKSAEACAALKGQTAMKSMIFDAAEYLDTPERQADYLALALESGDPEEVLDAQSLIAHARGKTALQAPQLK